ncbi:MAG: hypothetical protein HWE10_09895 [Gammaproteobacteria bacterium]|nr:hypothetical protein [Gammaproteobacteria bacterium]
MKKKIIDVKTELKKPKTFVQKATVTKPKRFPDVYPFLRPHSQETLKEVLGDLRFITGREKIVPFELLDVFLHYWINETKREGRNKVAKKLAAAHTFAYRRMKDEQRAEHQEAEQFAERLLEALLPSDSSGEVTANV